MRLLLMNRFADKSCSQHKLYSVNRIVDCLNDICRLTSFGNRHWSVYRQCMLWRRFLAYSRPGSL